MAPILQHADRPLSRAASIALYWPAVCGGLVLLGEWLGGVPVAVLGGPARIFVSFGAPALLFWGFLLYSKFFGGGVRIARRVIEANFSFCGVCGYTLTGLVEHGVCPECGQTYDLGENQVYWRALFDRPRAEERPRFGRRHKWPIWFLFLAVAAGTMAPFLFAGRPRFSLLIYCGSMLGWWTVGFWRLNRAWKKRHNRRLALKLVQSEYSLCGRCGANLRNRSPRGECPSCGTSYDVDDLRRRWRIACPAHWELLMGNPTRSVAGSIGV